jgi:hypothetical protein
VAPETFDQDLKWTSGFSTIAGILSFKCVHPFAASTTPNMPQKRQQAVVHMFSLARKQNLRSTRQTFANVARDHKTLRKLACQRPYSHMNREIGLVGQAFAISLISWI